jgi:hypothetical protein
MALYLWTNSALYLCFAIWMTLSPASTAKAVGYLSLSPSGRSEFLVIYGGLQLGLAAFFGLCAYRPSMSGAGVWLAVLLYAPIALYRVTTVIRFWPVERTTLVVGGLEVALFVWALILMARVR